MSSEKVLYAPISASVVSEDGTQDCVRLCEGCPRRTGEITVKKSGIKGLFGATEKAEIHSNPLKSGEITRIESNGRHGIFSGEGNTGTVTSLTPESAEFFINKIANCEGPVDNGNVCPALGNRNENAMYALDYSFETASGHEDLNPIEVVVNR